MNRLAPAALLLLCCGCGGDRTGRAEHVTRLTLDAPASTIELEGYVQTVAQLSHGALRIRIEQPRGDEQQAIDAVRAGRADLGAVGARAWSGGGFPALGAPMLIDSLALEGAVLRSGVTAPMLRSLTPLGFAGIGVLPGPLRRPFGVTRPLLAPADYRGLRFGVTASTVTAAMLRTLGATPVVLPFNSGLGELDAVEEQITAIEGNGHDARGGFLTGNVVLSPRPVVVFASRRRMNELTAGQRSVLARAAQAFAPKSLVELGSEERDAMQILCRRGRTRLVSGDAAALRRALAPVTRRLERDPATRSAIAAIEALKRRETLPADDAPACEGAAPAPATAAPTRFDGVYRMVTSIERDTRGDPDPLPENYGVLTYVFTRGRFAITQDGGAACTWGYGTYAVAGDRVEWRFTDGGGIAPDNAANKPGEDFVFRWNRYRDTLTLRPSPGGVSPLNFRVKPWRRIASAPSRRYFAKRCPPPAAALPHQQ